MLAIKNLTKIYKGGKEAVSNLSLTVNAGDICAFIGHNGAGKTSTLKVISGLLKPTSGEIIFDGVDIAGKPAHKVAKQGIMQSPEGRFVLVGLTVEENLRVGGYNIKDKEELARNFERVYTLDRKSTRLNSSHCL